MIFFLNTFLCQLVSMDRAETVKRFQYFSKSIRSGQILNISASIFLIPEFQVTVIILSHV